MGQTVSPETIAIRLNAFGYSREDQVSLPGTFSRRGDIIDIFPADADRPLRIDLFGDDIESIRHFDVETQRSEGKIESVTVNAAHEVIFTRESIARAVANLRQLADRRVSAMEHAKEESIRIERLRESADNDIARLGQAAYFAGIERYLPLLHPHPVSVLEYLGDNLMVVIDEPAQMKSHAERDIDSVLKNLAGRAERSAWNLKRAYDRQPATIRPSILSCLLALFRSCVRKHPSRRTRATPKPLPDGPVPFWMPLPPMHAIMCGLLSFRCKRLAFAVCFPAKRLPKFRWMHRSPGR